MDLFRKKKKPQLSRRGLLATGIALLLVAGSVFLIVEGIMRKPENGPDDIAAGNAADSDVSMVTPGPGTDPVSQPADNASPELLQDDGDEEDAPDEDPWDQDDVDSPFFEPGKPILVNRSNYIPDDYDPDLVPIAGDNHLNRRAAEALGDMFDAAAADGISLWIVSAYRSNESQTRNFNNRKAQHMAEGKTEEEAYELTAAVIAVPGTSEHTLGLAVDINSLSVSFEDTAAFEWLIENCADYGFILRYAKDKTDKTGITFEPWHYRYVGSNHARRIMDSGVCLEEYLDALN
ncbi:MAG: D-alanyl-D-alanine carboxypeptidase family protein [Oscillospiraceae bacterium]|nr:D-alanyl-D-alanine carboxypeptidase family protein [Oscillospiraceae bacterium]